MLFVEDWALTKQNMKKTTLTIASLAFASLASGQTVLNPTGYGTGLIDDFNSDAAGTFASGYVTDDGTTIQYLSDGPGLAIVNGPIAGSTDPDTSGDGHVRFVVNNSPAPTTTRARFNFAAAQTGFILDITDWGADGNTPSSLKVTASDGTVIFDWDEAVDGVFTNGGANQHFFIGIDGGSFTGFTVDSNSSGSDNWGISKITNANVPEPSSALLLGLSGLALIGRRKRA